MGYSVPSLVLIAQVVFLLERGQTRIHRRATHWALYSRVKETKRHLLAWPTLLTTYISLYVAADWSYHDTLGAMDRPGLIAGVRAWGLRYHWPGAWAWRMSVSEYICNGPALY